jgi:hypothetical protein
VVWGNPEPPPYHWHGLGSAELQRGSFFGPAEPPSATPHAVTIAMAELVQIEAAGRTLHVQSWFLSKVYGYAYKFFYKLLRHEVSAKYNHEIAVRTLSALLHTANT